MTIPAAPPPTSDVPTPPAAIPGWKRNLPNALTMARMGLAVVFFVVLAGYEYAASSARSSGLDLTLLVASGVFILAAVTDALDGHLARKWGVVSLFGRVMDPFADKLLVLGGFAYLSGAMFAVHDTRGHWYQASGVYPAMAVVVLARELLITSLRGVFESRGVSFAATASGKWKMILQSVCIPLVLLLLATTQVLRFTETGIEMTPSGYVIIATVWATVIVTVWSGVPYVLRAIRESGKLSESKP